MSDTRFVHCNEIMPAKTFNVASENRALLHALRARFIENTSIISHDVTRSNCRVTRGSSQSAACKPTFQSLARDRGCAPRDFAARCPFLSSSIIDKQTQHGSQRLCKELHESTELKRVRGDYVPSNCSNYGFPATCLG